MVDLDLFEKILQQEDGLIEQDDIINDEFFIRLQNYSASQISKLFKKTKTGVHTFQLNINSKCCRCGKELYFKLSKTSVLDLFRKKEIPKFYCTQCENDLKEINRKLSIQREEERKLKIEEQRAENTMTYINMFLNPNKVWEYGISNWKKIKDLEELYEKCNKEDIKNYIKSMKYYDFLKTPYWKAISERVRKKAGYRCSLCNSNSNLSVHHRTYDIHGEELFHMNELICICQNCHDKHHNHK